MNTTITQSKCQILNKRQEDSNQALLTLAIMTLGAFISSASVIFVGLITNIPVRF